MKDVNKSDLKDTGIASLIYVERGLAKDHTCVVLPLGPSYLKEVFWRFAYFNVAMWPPQQGYFDPISSTMASMVAIGRKFQ